MEQNILRKCIETAGFSIVHEVDPGPGREAINVDYSDLNLSPKSLSFLKEKKKINTLWSHQHKAIKLAKEGRNICITTSTSSGKSEIFQIAAIENLSRNPKGKVLAIYPMKALTAQQQERWEKTGLKVQKIDGSVNMSERVELLSNADVLVMTPDVIHAWLMGNINNKDYGNAICEFIGNISMVILDELHLYKGLFGSNCAYLYRRLNNIRRLIRKKEEDLPQYITASATLPDAVGHSSMITGANDFIEIGAADDGSPMCPKGMFFIESGKSTIKDLIYEIKDCIPDSKSITFVASRATTTALSFDFNKGLDSVESSGILPYRAGLTPETVKDLSKRMETGDFRGIVSTTSLEIGIDIDGLNVVILADMPIDKNSYQQQIGRVGRFGCKGDSFVIFCLNERSVSSQLLFNDFKYDVDKVYPDIKPTLYLDDEKIMDVHAYCHVGYEECEYKRWIGNLSKENKQFRDGGLFPKGFVDLCTDVIRDQVSEKYTHVVKECTGSDPYHTFSLRSFEKQYKVILKDVDSNETLSKSQVTREAYKGAVRTTIWKTIGFKQRVKSVEDIRGEVHVTEVNNFTTETSPRKITYLIPNFKPFAIKSHFCVGETQIFNQELVERVVIYGYTENGQYHKDPDGPYKSVKQTTGTLFFHPALTQTYPQIPPMALTDMVSDILFEAFLRCSAFDRSDMNHRGGRLYNTYGNLRAGTRYVALYDASEFNLSLRVLEESRLRDMFRYLMDHKRTIMQACLLVAENSSPILYAPISNIIDLMCKDILNNEIVDDSKPKEEKVLKNGTKVVFLQKNANDTKVIAKVPSIYIASDNAGNPVLMIDGSPRFGVEWTDLEFTEDTEFENAKV